MDVGVGEVMNRKWSKRKCVCDGPSAVEYFVEEFWALGYREYDVAQRVLWRSPASTGDALSANLILTTATRMDSAW